MRVNDPGPATGQKLEITELWAWTAHSPETGVEGIIALQEPVAIPLVGATRAIVERFKPFADEVGRQTGSAVRLRRFVAAEED